MVFRNLFLVIFILFAGKMLSQTAMPYRWNTVCIGGGGFVSGIVTSDACKDLVYARTDVGGAYRWNADTRSWTALTDWAGEEELGFLGVESIAIDENDADKLYLCVGTSYWNNGKSAILISEDRGDTFSVVDVSGQFRFHGNGIGRGGGERLAVHPANSKILFCGTRADGLWKSSDGAATWTKVESFPIDNLSKENGITSVFFDSDRRRGHGGLSKVFVTTSVRGNPNFFVSEDCGNTWKAVEGARTDYAIQHVAQASDRTLYICYADGCPPHASSLGVLARGAVMKYHVDTGEWLDITPMRQSRPYCGVSVCRDNPEKVVVTTTNAYGLQRWHEEDVYGDEVFRSSDGGKTWSPMFAEKRNKLDHGDFVWGKKHSLHWASDIETAFWKMENVEAHCYTSMLAYQIGGPRKFSDREACELVKIRKAMGMIEQGSDDHYKECGLCDSKDEFRPACVCGAKAPSPSNAGFNKEAEELVAKITKIIIQELKK